MDSSGNPAKKDPDAWLLEAKIPIRDGKVRMWAYLSDGFSPPQASGGVMEESSLLEDGEGVDPNIPNEGFPSSCQLEQYEILVKKI